MIVLDTGGAVPPYEQVRAQIAARIHDGRLAAGHRLPSIRQLAGDLRIAPGTIARAYSELEAAGLITTSRASGSRVLGGNTAQEAVLRAAERLSRVAQAAGVSERDLAGILAAAWQRTAESDDSAERYGA